MGSDARLRGVLLGLLLRHLSDTMRPIISTVMLS